jgi:hypothetical protein
VEVKAKFELPIRADVGVGRYKCMSLGTRMDIGGADSVSRVMG